MGDTPRSEPSADAVRRAGGKAARPGRPASRAEPADPVDPAAPAESGGRAEPGGRAAAKRRIGIRELRQHASIYVDLAERGYTVDITNRGRLVAQLVPVREAGSPLERLIAAGILEPAEEPGGVADIEPYPVTARPSAGEQR
jgi:prevent-host-death family protein